MTFFCHKIILVHKFTSIRNVRKCSIMPYRTLKVLSTVLVVTINMYYILLCVQNMYIYVLRAL